MRCDGSIFKDKRERKENNQVDVFCCECVWEGLQSVDYKTLDRICACEKIGMSYISAKQSLELRSLFLLCLFWAALLTSAFRASDLSIHSHKDGIRRCIRSYSDFACRHRVSMSSSRNPKASKAQEIKDVLKLPFKVFSGAANVAKSSAYTALDGADVIISSIRKDDVRDGDDTEVQTIPSSVLQYTQGIERDKVEEINALEKVGNVTLTTKQIIRAVNPITVIGSGLKGVQNVLNVVYDIQDAMEETEIRKDEATRLGTSGRISAQKWSESTENDENTVKEIVYGTIDSVTAVVDGVVTVVKAVPKTIEAIQNIPLTIQEKKIEADRKIARVKQSVDEFLAWRPLDDAQRAIVSTQRNLNDKIDGVQRLGSKLKSIVDPPPPPPAPSPLSSLETSSPSKPLTIEAVKDRLKNKILSTGDNVKSSNVYSEGKNILEKMAESNSATLERLERERLWRIANGYEDEKNSIPIGGLKSPPMKLEVTERDILMMEQRDSQQQQKSSEDTSMKFIPSPEADEKNTNDDEKNTNDDDDDSQPPPSSSSSSSSSRFTKYTTPPPGPRRKYNPF